MTKQHEPMPLRFKHYYSRDCTALLPLLKMGIALTAQDWKEGFLDASRHARPEPGPSGLPWEDVQHWLCGNPSCPSVLVHFEPGVGAWLQEGFVWSKQKKKYIKPDVCPARIPEHAMRNIEDFRREPHFDRILRAEIARYDAASGRRPRPHILIKEHWLPALINCPACGRDSRLTEVRPPDAQQP